MAQHGMKQKTKLPKGVKQKVKKPKVQNHPRKGSNVTLPPKKKSTMEDARVGAAVSKLINDKNEEIVRHMADKSQGRNSKAKK